MADRNFTTAETVIADAKQANIAITTAESCTGGMLATALTDIAGSSSVFIASFVTYANAAKSHMLAVPPATIAKHGAVSQETALAMAGGAYAETNRMLGDRDKQACIAIAITGIAGPDGGSKEKPVGLVWFGLAVSGKQVRAESQHFTGGRAAIRVAATQHALAMLLAAIGSLAGG